MLTQWTKKILLEEGHSMPQLVHILQLIVRHYKVGVLDDLFFLFFLNFLMSVNYHEHVLFRFTIPSGID